MTRALALVGSFACVACCVGALLADPAEARAAVAAWVERESAGD